MTEKLKIKIKKDIPLEKVLETLLGPLAVCVGVCIMILIVISVYLAYTGTVKNIHFETTFCKLNTLSISTKSFVIITTILVLILIGVFVIVDKAKIEVKIKFSILILSSILILFMIIYLTGGILDSPFSSAVGVYVSTYFIVQEQRNDLHRFNKIVLILVLSLTIFPYAIMYFNNTSNSYSYIISWNTDNNTNILRLLLVIFLIGFAGYWGNKVNKDLIKKFNEINNLTNE